MTQLRLIMAAVFALALAGAAVLVYMYRAEAIEERGKRAVAEINLLAAVRDNERLVDHVISMEEQARVNNEIVLDLANSVAKLRAEQVETTRERGNLKAENNDVKEFLNRPTPEPLRRLLDKRLGSKDPAGLGRPRPNPVEPAP